MTYRRFDCQRKLSNAKRAWFDAAKTAYVTHILAAMALAVFTVSDICGIKDQATEILGVQTGETYTLLTHAFMHGSWPHLIGNLVMLEGVGPLVEKWMGKLFYISALAFITITGAQFSLSYAPEHWDTGTNPIGMSISTTTLVALGIYFGAQKFITGKSRRMVQLARNAKREASSWAAVAIVAAISTAFLWIESDVTAGPTRIGHTTGAVMGVGIAAINTVIRTFRDAEHKETDEE